MDKAEEFIGTMNLHEFMEDNKTAYAVIRSFEIIGEAAKKIHPRFVSVIHLYRGRI